MNIWTVQYNNEFVDIYFFQLEKAKQECIKRGYDLNKCNFFRF